MDIVRKWAMPNHKTFDIKCIKELIEKYMSTKIVVDPFPFPFEKDALEYLKTIPTNSTSYVLFDPPYSPRQLKEMYGGLGLSYDTKSSYWSNLKDEIYRITKKDAIVISFGWNSNGIGKKRDFEIIEILMVAHGGSHNDTICVVERKK